MRPSRSSGATSEMIERLRVAQRGETPRRATGQVRVPRRPPQPKFFEEAGVSYRTLENLILKTIKQKGPQNERDLSDAIRLSANILHPLVISLFKRELLDTTEPLHYDLTGRGRELTALVERDDSYVGPAPVSLEAYSLMCVQQAERELPVGSTQVDEAFADYTVESDLRREIKEGFNSGRALLFYGPPGNGKSTITGKLHQLLIDPVLIPYAFEFNGRVVQLYDHAFHKPLEDAMREEERAAANSPDTGDKPDRRWLISRPPLVTVGTEFKVSHFEVAYDGQFSAPPHVKANNGIFVLDDLGRQAEDHNLILNQFIYPLQERETIVKFTGGSAMTVPYRQRLFLSTNLNHEEIIDDAFRRRLPYQILVDRPTETQWQVIFIAEATRRGFAPDTAATLAASLMDWYRQDERVVRSSDPRDLLDKLEVALDEGQSIASIDIALMRRIYERYPAAHKRDAKSYVGALEP